MHEREHSISKGLSHSREIAPNEQGAHSPEKIIRGSTSTARVIGCSPEEVFLGVGFRSGLNTRTVHKYCRSCVTFVAGECSCGLPVLFVEPVFLRKIGFVRHLLIRELYCNMRFVMRRFTVDQTKVEKL